MTHPDSFGARATFDVGGASHEIFRLDALQEKYDVARLPYSLKILLENLLRNEDGGAVTQETIESVAKWVATDEPSQEIAYSPSRVLMQDFTGVPAIVDLAAMRDAMDELGRRPREDQPARARRAGDRPLDPGRQLRRAARIPEERRARVRAQPRALRVPALGPDGLRRLLGGPAEHRHLPPGQPRVPLPCGRVARRAGLSRHARRHRLPHHDGQRPRRARLGRGRHRGRGRDARPARVDAAAAGRRLQARGRAARGLDRHRPRPDRHPDAARARRGRQVRRVLRTGARQPPARRPRDDRQHVAGVRLDLRDLPGRRRDAALPRVLRPPGGADRARRGVHQRAGPLPRRGRARRPRTPTRSSST